MDLDMPIMNGYDATWQIRDVLKSSITIVALTANSTDKARQKCREIGMNDFFTKPITVNAIHEMITKWS